MRRAALLLHALLAVTLSAVTAQARTLGMVVDAGGAVTVFDADTDSVLGSVQIGPGQAVGDCSVTRDETLGFVTDFARVIFVAGVVLALLIVIVIVFRLARRAQREYRG